MIKKFVPPKRDTLHKTLRVRSNAGLFNFSMLEKLYYKSLSGIRCTNE
jgi:hypothetical protein